MSCVCRQSRLLTDENVGQSKCMGTTLKLRKKICYKTGRETDKQKTCRYHPVSFWKRWIQRQRVAGRGATPGEMPNPLGTDATNRLTLKHEFYVLLPFSSFFYTYLVDTLRVLPDQSVIFFNSNGINTHCPKSVVIFRDVTTQKHFTDCM